MLENNLGFFWNKTVAPHNLYHNTAI